MCSAVAKKKKKKKFKFELLKNIGDFILFIAQLK